MPTDLRCDTAFLKSLLEHAVRLHRPKNIEEATMLADIRDYIMYLTLDAIDDPSLAETLVKHFTQLQAWLEEKAQESPVWRHERETIQWYMGFIFALEQLLSLKHEIAMLPTEKISREDFKRSWKQIAEKLGL
jgi:hypothetical protein